MYKQFIFIQHIFFYEYSIQFSALQTHCHEYIQYSENVFNTLHFSISYWCICDYCWFWQLCFLVYLFLYCIVHCENFVHFAYYIGSNCEFKTFLYILISEWMCHWFPLILDFARFHESTLYKIIFFLLF